MRDAFQHSLHSKDFTFNSCILQSNFKCKAWAQHPQIPLPELSEKKQIGGAEEQGCRKGQEQSGGPGEEMPVELRPWGVTGQGNWSLLSARHSMTHTSLRSVLSLLGGSWATGVEHYLYMALPSVLRCHFNLSSTHSGAHQ